MGPSIHSKKSLPHLSQRQLLFKFNIIFNTLLGFSFFLGGVEHQFCYDEQHWCHKLPWKLAQFVGIPALPMSSCMTMLTFVKVSEKMQTRLYKWTLFIGLVLAVEEAWLEIIGFGQALLIGNLSILLFSMVSTVFRSWRIIEYTTWKVFVGVGIQLIYVIYYMELRKKCNLPYAFSQHGCPFPDWFNHNAVLHLVMITSYRLTSSAFMV